MIYFVLKNLVLPRDAGSSMGQACPVLRESEFSDSALEFGVLNHKFQTGLKRLFFVWDLLFGNSISYIKAEMLECGD